MEGWKKGREEEGERRVGRSVCGGEGEEISEGGRRRRWVDSIAGGPLRLPAPLAHARFTGRQRCPELTPQVDSPRPLGCTGWSPCAETRPLGCTGRSPCAETRPLGCTGWSPCAETTLPRPTPMLHMHTVASGTCAINILLLLSQQYIEGWWPAVPAQSCLDNRPCAPAPDTCTSCEMG